VFGHKWESAEGTITGATAQPGAGHHHHQHPHFVYSVDVQLPDGRTLPGRQVEALSYMHQQLPPGTTVRLEVNEKTGEVRFNEHHAVIQTPSARGARESAARPQLPTSIAGLVAGAMSGNLNDMVAGLREAAEQGRIAPGVQGGPGMTVISSSNVSVDGGPTVTSVGGQDVAELIHELRGGPAERAAAMEKIKALKQEAITRHLNNPGAGPGPVAQQPHQPAQPEGFNSPGPSSFDTVASAPPVSPAAPMAPTATPGGVHFTPPTVGGGSSFGEPSTSFSPPATNFTPPTTSFGPTGGSTFGSPAATFGESKADRLSRLQDQRDRGQLTEEQYQAQRQQIQDEF
jgi:hypothetical protein